MTDSQTHRQALIFKALAVLLLAATLLWGAWITHTVTGQRPVRIVSVRLAETVGAFVDTAARADADPAAVQTASLAYLKAAEAAVADMGADGRIVLVAEAVLAGDAPDATPELEARIARRLGWEAQP